MYMIHCCEVCKHFNYARRLVTVNAIAWLSESVTQQMEDTGTTNP